jgi:DNA-directed RNA polymerase subunit RPC12/RpoP
MIEVIKHGKPQFSRVVTTKCPNCDCIFKFNVDEDTYHDRIWCGDFIECPDCGEKIMVRDTSAWCGNDPDRIICDVVE